MRQGIYFVNLIISFRFISYFQVYIKLLYHSPFYCIFGTIFYKMALFQQSVAKKYIGDLDQEKLRSAYHVFQRHFGSPIIQKNIREAKEEEYQEGFVRDLFVNVFGYILKPKPSYNFVLEKKNEKDSRKSDGAILVDQNVIGVVELKGTVTIDL